MKDYILFSCEHDINEKIAKELHKEDIECIFLENEISEAIKLISPYYRLEEQCQSSKF
jgi:hypothetical protein